MSLAHRVEAGLALAVVFFLIFATNQVDKQHFQKVQDTINTVFDDRVMAQDYIYQMDHVLHEKELRLARGEFKLVPEENHKLDSLIERFDRTKLTREEEKLFARFQKDFETLRQVEQSTLPVEEKTKALDRALASLQNDLDLLAQVQVDESHRLTMTAQKSLDSTHLTSKIEIGVLVIVGLIMQILIFVKPWGSSEPAKEPAKE